jgi:endonuclease/exonuclease/phosphatase family metal-dependent hydrolase
VSTLTVGSYNVWKHASIDGFNQDIERLCNTNADVIGLQECKGRDRARTLDGLAEWGAYNPTDPDRAEFDPIIWRRARFELVSTGSRRVAKGNRSVPVRYANWVELVDRVTGRAVFVINTHVHAGISRDGHPRWWLARTRQAYGHIAAIGELVEYLQGRGEVFVTGDFNIDWTSDKKVGHPRFPYRVLHQGRNINPCWLWSRAKGGTHGSRGRKIDYVWHRRSPRVTVVKARILRDGLHSDHNAVLATYNIT